MGKDYAKFTGEIAKGIKIGESSIELKLIIPLKAALPHLAFLSNSQGDEVNVLLGDPQASFDFEDQDDMYRKWTGRRVTTDSSGVVLSAQKPEPERDENQAEMFGPKEPGNDTPAGDDQAEQEEQTDQVDQDEQSDDQNPDDHEGEGTFDDIPEWMRGVDGDPEVSDEEDGQPGDDSAPREMNFGEDESVGAAEGSDQEPNASETVEIDKDTLENYILENRPVFEDLPLDFPALYEQKRKEGVTWRDIAVGVGMTTGQLNTQLTKYKGRVKEQMAQSTAV
ncbi:hypothetical protein [Paenibacillus sp. S29]|uniref:hypothetical protein n=1 Tax=Paenibacillus sp. S29 TaxID=3394611 RepID=UPI0039BEF91A